MLERQLGKIYVLGITLIAFYISATFNACSDVGFEQTQEIMQRLSNEGVVINQGARYTTSTDVTVSLYNPYATKMLISDSPDCSTGEWENYTEHKAWNLSSDNSTVAVYAKFLVDGEEGECLSDDIVHDDIPATLQFAGEQDSFSNLDAAAISFNVADSGSGVGEIKCSLSKQADAQFQLCPTSVALNSLFEGNHTFYVKVWDQAGNATPIQEFRWVTDYSAPALNFNSTPAKTSGTANSNFSFSAADLLSGIKKSECKVDASDFQPCTSPLNLELAEGPHKLTVKTYDKAGNMSEEISYDWVIDLTAPVVRITNGPKPFSNTKAASFEFTGRDGNVNLTAFMCKLDANPFAPCTSPQSYANLAEGNHTFTLKAVDAAGNDSAEITYTWLVDTIAPNLTIASGPQTIIKETSVQYSLNSSDAGSGIEKIECQVDGGGYQDCTANPAFSSLAAGNHKIDFRSFDRAGNTSATVSSTFMIDNVVPTVAISKGPNPFEASAEASFEFAAADTHSGIDIVECRLSSELEYSPCTSPKSYSNLSEGPISFFVRARDKAGNVSQEARHDWEIDMTGPEILFGQTPSQVFINDSVNILFSINDTASGLANHMCYLDATPTEKCTNKVAITLDPMNEGRHIFRVIATDNVGNASAKEISWDVVNNIKNYESDFDIKENNSVDILFVVDNSGSMKKEQENMASRVSGFLDIVQGLDWRVAVITTDSRNTNELNADGRLLEIEGLDGQYYITPNTPNGQNLLAETIEMGTEGTGKEEGIHSTFRAIERYRAAVPGAANTDFFRENAHFAVVLISDEDETPKRGHMNNPQNMVNYVKSVWPGKNFVYNSIVWNPAVQCKTGYKEGLKYIELSNLTNGIVGNVCSNDYTSQLADIGKKVLEQSQSLTLECPPIDSDDNGTPNVTITYSSDSGATYTPVTEGFNIVVDKVVFDQALPRGLYKANYSCIVQAGMEVAGGS